MSTKNRLAVVATAVLLLITVIACKKDKAKSTQELLMGKWNFHTYVQYQNDNGTEDSTTEDYSTSGYYLDFLNNSDYVVNFSIPDTSVYELLNNQSIEFDGGDTARVITLTENQLTLVFKYIYDANSYEERRYYLSK